MKHGPRYAAAIVLALLVAGGFSLVAQKAPAIPDTPAGNSVTESLDIIETGDIERIQEFISRKFTPGFIKKFGRKRLFEVYYGFFEKYSGLELHKIRESSPQRFVGVFRCRRTGSAFLFGLGVVPKPPHKIQGLTILPMTHPDEPESLTSLTETEKIGMLGSYLDILGESGVFSGAVLLAKDGRVVFQKASGLAVREKGLPNTVETRFNLASLNKMFTAVAVAQLCEQGKLSYDDPVGKYLGSDWLPANVSRKVQIKHLLSHTSGIGIGKGDDNLLYLEKYIGQEVRRVDDYKPLTQGAFFKADPGEEFTYSNMGFHLLGAVIERISGRSYDAYVQTNIFDVAGMKDAGFDELDTLDSKTARGYIKEQKSGQISWTSNASKCNWKGTPAGGAYSTIGDLLKFEQALKNDLLVSRATKELLFAPKAGLGAPSYGYGFSVRRFDEHLKVGHTGGYAGINNLFSMYLDSGYTIIILSNIDLLSGSAASDIEFYICGLFFNRGK
ncbi:MAG: beta-lactamase family protein [Candidatus Aminicenantes bacterium]|nr:beta-lactamase family protein [Candidatus Aminicenantes bacterium]